MCWKVGQRVAATQTLVEGDRESLLEAVPGEPGWVHCRAGDEGWVVSVDRYADGAVFPTVRFDHSGTATLCDSEVELRSASLN